jgi:hypothetical protein
MLMAGDENKVDAQSREAGYETHDAYLKPIIIVGLASVILLVLILILIDQYFIVTKEHLVDEMVLTPQSAALRELRSREDETLSSYKIVDVEKGIYRIPVSRAMELLADEAYKKQQTGNREQ